MVSSTPTRKVSDVGNNVYIPAKARFAVYAILGALGLVIGSIQVGFAALGNGNPDWLTVALAVYPFLAGGLGYTAATYTPTEQAEQATTDAVAVAPPADDTIVG